MRRERPINADIAKSMMKVVCCRRGILKLFEPAGPTLEGRMRMEDFKGAAA